MNKVMLAVLFGAMLFAGCAQQTQQQAPQKNNGQQPLAQAEPVTDSELKEVEDELVEMENTLKEFDTTDEEITDISENTFK